MQSTFRIHGIAKKDPQKTPFGTVFFVGKSTKDGKRAYYVLVTAAHVLDEIRGDEATIWLRETLADNSFRPYFHQFKIRDKGIDLYTKHPVADVAVMYFDMPLKDPFELADDKIFASDERIRSLELHPGDELICLGFPQGVAANDMGFPILRSGRLASYPLLPTKTVKKFLFDFMVFPGNSGGPVYFNYDVRQIGDHLQHGGMMGILGLVSEQAFPSAPELANEPLKLGIVVPSTIIKDTIDMLPSRD